MTSALLESHGAKLENHIQTFDGKPLQAQPCFQQAFQMLWSTTSAASSLDLAGFTEQVLMAVDNTHSVNLLSLAALLKDNKQEGMTGVLQDDKKLASMVKSRSIFFLSKIAQSSVGCTRCRKE